MPSHKLVRWASFRDGKLANYPSGNPFSSTEASNLHLDRSLAKQLLDLDVKGQWSCKRFETKAEAVRYFNQEHATGRVIVRP